MPSKKVKTFIVQKSVLSLLFEEINAAFCNQNESLAIGNYDLI